MRRCGSTPARFAISSLIGELVTRLASSVARAASVRMSVADLAAAKVDDLAARRIDERGGGAEPDVVLAALERRWAERDGIAEEAGDERGHDHEQPVAPERTEERDDLHAVSRGLGPGQRPSVKQRPVGPRASAGRESGALRTPLIAHMEPEPSTIVAVRPAAALAARPRLFAALEAAFPVCFRPWGARRSRGRRRVRSGRMAGGAHAGQWPSHARAARRRRARKCARIDPVRRTAVSRPAPARADGPGVARRPAAAVARQRARGRRERAGMDRRGFAAAGAYRASGASAGRGSRRRAAVARCGDVRARPASCGPCPAAPLPRRSARRSCSTIRTCGGAAMGSSTTGGSSPTLTRTATTLRWR